MTGHRIILQCLLAAIGAGSSVPILAQSGSYSAPAVINRPASLRIIRPAKPEQSLSFRRKGGRASAGRWPQGTYQATGTAAAQSGMSRGQLTAPQAIANRSAHLPRLNSSARRPVGLVRYPLITESQTSRQRLLPPDSPPPRSWNAPAVIGYTPIDDFAPAAELPIGDSPSVIQTAVTDTLLEVNTIGTTVSESPLAQTSLNTNTGVWQSTAPEPPTYQSSSVGEFETALVDHLHPETEFFVRGWLSQGFPWNPDSPSNNFNLPTTFNDRANEYQLNQLYVSMGIDAERSAIDWDIGGQVDLLYGTDYFFTTSLGLETHDDGTPRWNSDGPRNGGGAALYGLAMPQLFAELWAPVGNGVSLKFGHFYTTLGHEVVAAPDNFFYSHAYTMQYGEPFTHTGFLATTEVTDGVTVHGGFTRGWDNWEDPGSDLSFLGGVQLDWDRTSLAYAVHIGDEDILGDDTRSTYSLVLTHHLSDQMRYIFQHDFGYQENGAPISLDTAKWYGINQYLIVDLCDTLSVGNRFEWFRDHNNARVLGAPAEGGNYFNYTFGLNWRPMPNMVVRPELRWDWSDVTPPFGLNGVYDDFSDKNQFTLGMDVILSF